MPVDISFSKACMILSLRYDKHESVEWRGRKPDGIDKEFILYRGILGPAHGQLFQLP